MSLALQSPCDLMNSKKLIKYIKRLNEQGANIPLYPEDLESPHDLCRYVEEWERNHQNSDIPDPNLPSPTQDSEDPDLTQQGLSNYRNQISKDLVPLLDKPLSELTPKQKTQIMALRLMGAHPKYVLSKDQLRQRMTLPNYQVYDSIRNEEASMDYTKFFPNEYQKRKRLLDEIDFVANDDAKQIEAKSSGFLTRTQWGKKKTSINYLKNQGIDLDSVAPITHRRQVKRHHLMLTSPSPQPTRRRRKQYAS